MKVCGKNTTVEWTIFEPILTNMLSILQLRISNSAFFRKLLFPQENKKKIEENTKYHGKNVHRPHQYSDIYNLNTFKSPKCIVINICSECDIPQTRYPVKKIIFTQNVSRRHLDEVNLYNLYNNLIFEYPIVEVIKVSEN